MCCTPPIQGVRRWGQRYGTQVFHKGLVLPASVRKQLNSEQMALVELLILVCCVVVVVGIVFGCHTRSPCAQPTWFSLLVVPPTPQADVHSQHPLTSLRFGVVTL